MACAVPEEMLPGYGFSPRWVVRYKPGSPEHARRERFRAMGVAKGERVGEAVFVRAYVPASRVARGKVVLEGPPAVTLTARLLLRCRIIVERLHGSGELLMIQFAAIVFAGVSRLVIRFAPLFSLQLTRPRLACIRDGYW